MVFWRGELTSDAFMVALVGAGFAPPILIFGLFGGSLADRWNRRKMIQYAQLTVSIVALIVAISIVKEWVSIWVLFGAALTQGFCWSFMMPARQAIIPQLVPDRELTNAVALNASGMALMTLSGPAIGGLAYAALGPQATYFLMSGLMFFAFLMMTRVKVERPDASNPGRRRENVFDSIWDGIRYSYRNKTILILLLLTLATTMTSQSFRSLMPVQVDVVFGGGARELGILMSAIGVGALIGSLFIAGLTQNVQTRHRAPCNGCDLRGRHPPLNLCFDLPDRDSGDAGTRGRRFRTPCLELGTDTRTNRRGAPRTCDEASTCLTLDCVPWVPYPWDSWPNRRASKRPSLSLELCS